MTMNVANNQWSTRPADERFWTIKEAVTASLNHKANSVQLHSALGDLRIGNLFDQPALVGKAGKPALMSNYAFGQLARYVGAPASYVQSLPGSLAAQCLDEGLTRLKSRESSREVNLLFGKVGVSLQTRALTSERYDRVWNAEVLQALDRNLVQSGWVVPPARPAGIANEQVRIATQDDVIDWQTAAMGGAPIKVGDKIAPAGIYVSDHDMFVLLTLPAAHIEADGTMLSLFSITRNSEVGDCSLQQTLGLCDGICGNHLIWGERNVRTVSVRHTKSARVETGKTLQSFEVEARELADGYSRIEVSNQIRAAKSKILGATKVDVLDALFAFGKKNGLQRLTRKALEAGYEIACSRPRYGDTHSVWAQVNGLTELSQQTEFTDVRHEMDVQAGRLMEIAF